MAYHTTVYDDCSIETTHPVFHRVENTPNTELYGYVKTRDGQHIHPTSSEYHTTFYSDGSVETIHPLFYMASQNLGSDIHLYAGSKSN
jgi:hypothetical protein